MSLWFGFFFFFLSVSSQLAKWGEKKHTHNYVKLQQQQENGINDVSGVAALLREPFNFLFTCPLLFVYVARLNFVLKKKGGIKYTTCSTYASLVSLSEMLCKFLFFEPHFRDFLSLLTGDRGCFFFSDSDGYCICPSPCQRKMRSQNNSIK